MLHYLFYGSVGGNCFSDNLDIYIPQDLAICGRFFQISAIHVDALNYLYGLAYIVVKASPQMITCMCLRAARVSRTGCIAGLFVYKHVMQKNSFIPLVWVCSCWWFASANSVLHISHGEVYCWKFGGLCHCSSFEPAVFHGHTEGQGTPCM